MTKSNSSGIHIDILRGTSTGSYHSDGSSNDDCDGYSLKSGVSRSHCYSIFFLNLLGLYAFFVTRYLFAQQRKSIEEYGKDDATLRDCMDSDGGIWHPQQNLLERSNHHKENVSVDYRVLCTSVEKRIAWGSYKLRCNDLKRWTDVCAPNVDVTVGVSIEQLHEQWSKKPNNTKKDMVQGGDMDRKDTFFNATIFIKSLSRKNFSQFGNKYIDIVDEYNWQAEKVPTDFHLIFQTRWQGPSLFPNHTSSVVEHWYNSYPSDMVNHGYPEYIPSVEQKSSRHLKIATIWNTRRSHDPTEGGCPAMNVPGVKYSCLDKVIRQLV